MLRVRRFAVLAAALLAAVCAHAGELPLRAGFGRAPITPVVADAWTDVDGDGVYDEEIDRYHDRNNNGRFDAVYMAGFQSPRPAAGVHDELEAVAVVFDDGTTRVGIVAADVIGLSHSFVEKVRNVYAKELGLDYLVVHATHNHQGPDTQGIWGRSRLRTGIGDGYLKFLRQQMGTALAQAVRRLEPAEISVAEIRGRDRLIGSADTRKPEVIDDGLRVAIVTRAGGDDVLGTLVNFGNHVELTWDRNFELTADVAGWARRGLDAGLVYDRELYKAGLGGTTLWLTGNIGGLITTPPTLGVMDPRSGALVAKPSQEKARAQGYQIAEAVIDARAAGVFARVATPRVSVVKRDIDVPVANWPLVVAGTLGVLDRDVDLRFGFDTASEVALVTVGDLWIACVPGELYPEIAIGGIENPPGADYQVAPVEVPPLRGAMRGRVNMMVNLANDALGYIIPRSEWDEDEPWIYGNTEASYGEVVSAGPDTARIVHRALLRVFAIASGASPARKQ
ncbi:MAG: hypothetical protein ACHQ6V_08035 [Myxococcota bacterium]